MTDPLYVVARAALLDALEAIGEQRDAVVLVGAQAIYLHTGDSDLAVPAFTSDGDLAIEPARLKAEPKLADAMLRAHFRPGDQPGSWLCERTVRVWRRQFRSTSWFRKQSRGQDAEPHDSAITEIALAGALAASKARWLTMTLSARSTGSRRSAIFDIRVAGPSALLVVRAGVRQCAVLVGKLAAAMAADAASRSGASPAIRHTPVFGHGAVRRRA